MDLIEARIDTPAVWILVFRRNSKAWWVRLLARGRYKHVAAYAYVPGLKAWLFYDVTTGPTSIVALPDGQEREMMYWFTRDADLVSMRRNTAYRATLRRCLTFYCVPAIKDLIGLDSGALLVTTLYRDCLRAGGTPLGFLR